jgi:hypothetical protein
MVVAPQKEFYTAILLITLHSAWAQILCTKKFTKAILNPRIAMIKLQIIKAIALCSIQLTPCPAQH